jgi:hypothetical protein
MRDLRLMMVFCVLAALWPAEGGASPEQEAIGTAKEWLKFIDRGRYEESWETASALFQTAVRKDAWLRNLRAFRKPLGQVKSREVMSSRYTESLPGVPDGHYVVVKLRTSFENKEEAVETVTPVREENGQWKVSGYYIK